METIDYRQRQARKEHVCNFCGLKIPKGTVYIRSVVVDGGTAWTWKNHESCDELVSKLNMHDNDWGEGLDSQEFHDYIWEFVRENYPSYSEKKDELSWEEALEFTKKQLRIQG